MDRGGQGLVIPGPHACRTHQGYQPGRGPSRNQGGGGDGGWMLRYRDPREGGRPS